MLLGSGRGGVMVILLEGGSRRILLCGLEARLERYLNLLGFGIDVGVLMLLFVLRKLTLISLKEEGRYRCFINCSVNDIFKACDII